MFERISIELTNKCSKGCSFCYNESGPRGATHWRPDEVVAFVIDCAGHGVKAVSFGGGEPLEFDGVFEVLEGLDGVIFRSITTNGLLLDSGALRPLVDSKPDKVHVSLHFPQNRTEVARVVRHVHLLKENGIRTGVNLLVAKSQLEHAKRAAESLTAAGMTDEEIVYLPMRGCDTPTPEEVASVAISPQFQSMSCLSECAANQRFCSVRWDKTVAWCSYTESRRKLKVATYSGLCRAMQDLGLKPCDKSLVELSVDCDFKQDNKLSSQFTLYAYLAEPVDYPAAHSMDTEWFATDREGHVAVLETGEPGLMPKVFGDTHGFEYYTMVEEVLISGAKSIPFNLDDFFEFGEGIVACSSDFTGPVRSDLLNRSTTIDKWTQSQVEDFDKTSSGFWSRLVGWGRGLLPRTTQMQQDLGADVICWLRDESVLRRLPATAKPLNVGDRIAVWAPLCPMKLLRQLHDEGLLLGLVNAYPAADRFGFYVYECDDYGEGPYDRTAVPQRPITVTDLPEAAQEVVTRVRFEEIVFAETQKLQPADFVPCFGWYTDREEET